MKTFRTTGTGSEQTLSEIETDKIPLYPTEQDLLDDLANLEVGQIAGTIDPAESELIGVLIQRIQALENKLESDDVYSTEEVKTNKKWIDGKPIYRVVRHVMHNGTVTSGYSYSSSAKAYSGTFTIDCETPVSASVVYKAEDGRWGREYSQGWDSSCNIVWINDNSVYNHLAVNCLEVYIILEYTKTTED